MSFFFGPTPQMAALEAKVRLIARARGPVLIEGETGTGKERLAVFLHTLRGARGRLAILACDSSGFGSPARPGLGFAGRNEHTLLLKRIHRLPLERQERILALIDEGGQCGPFVICTASEDLERLVEAGMFAPELFYRIAAYRITVPPLRDRRQDIPDLFLSMLAEVRQECGLTARAPGGRAFDALVAHSWPGNLRELQNVVRAYVLTPDAAALEREIERRQRASLRVNGALVPLKEQVREAYKKIDAEIILRTLERNRWNRRRTAQSLSISYRSLLYKMKYCNIRAAAGAAER